MEKSMQLTKGMLTRIIKEELSHVLAEAGGPANAAYQKDWATLKRLADSRADEFPKGRDISRVEYITHNFLRQFADQIEPSDKHPMGGEKTLKSYAKWLENEPRIRKMIGAAWIKALNTKPRDDL